MATQQVSNPLVSPLAPDTATTIVGDKASSRGASSVHVNPLHVLVEDGAGSQPPLSSLEMPPARMLLRGAVPREGACGRVARVLGTEKFPVFLDLVEDRSYSRLVNVALFLAVFLFMLRVGLYALFLTDPFDVGGKTNVNLQALNGGVLVGAIGATLNPSVAVSVMGTDGVTPASNITVTISVALDNPALMLGQLRYGYEGTTYDMHGIPLNGRYSIPGLPPRAFTQPQLSGESAVSDKQGVARFRKLKMQLGLPATYLVSASAGDLTAEAGSVEFTSEVARVSIIPVPSLTIDAPVIQLHALLPPITVYIRDASGLPVAGKRAVLNSAPPSTDEFSSFASRPDLLAPRIAVFNNAVSSVSDYRGMAVFSNVSVVTSSSPYVIAEVVCDGTRSSDTLSFKVAGPPQLRLQIVQQPSSSVLEGTPLAQQPIVRVLQQVTPVGGGATELVPVAGVSVMAFPYMQAGFRSQTLMSPSTALELNLLEGSPKGVLANLGRTKLLSNFISNASDAAGYAHWDSAGFIRHGPAGNYTLTFALAGLFLDVETNVIDVVSSVAFVQHSAVNDAGAQLTTGYNVTIANERVYEFGAPYGSIWYTNEYPDLAFLPVDISGGLGATVQVTVMDALERPLAGKTVQPALAPAVAGDLSAIAAMSKIRIQEFPAPGNTPTRMADANSELDITREGYAEFAAHNAGFDQIAALEYGQTVGSFASFFRTVSAPLGTTAGLQLGYSVEGVLSNTLPFVVTNLDTDPSSASVCAAMHIVQSPGATAIQPGVSSFDSDFVVEALNSAGEPLPGLTVSMAVVDHLGFLIYNTVAGELLNLQQEYVSFLARTGGAAAFPLGSQVAGYSGLLLHNASGSAGTGSDGRARFPTWQPFVATNTYTRFAFTVIEYAPGSDHSQSASRACFTPYSPPVAAHSRVRAVQWVNAPVSSDNITCLSDGHTPISVVPQAEMVLLNGTVVPPGPDMVFYLLTQIDSDMRQYPSYLGVGATFMELSNNFAIGRPSTHRLGDVSSSPLLNSQGEMMLAAVLNVNARTIMATASGLVGYVDGAGVVQLHAGGPISSGIGQGGYTLPPLVQSAGAPGAFRYVAVAEGVVSPSWTPVVCTDNVSFVRVQEWNASNCPTNNSAYTFDANTGYELIRSQQPSSCANGCNGHGTCVCGVCVCSAGFDGASDCSLSFDADSFSILYSSDTQYRDQYAGLPVVDMREVMEADAFEGTDQFPTFLFASSIEVGAMSNMSALLEYAVTQMPSLTFSTVAPQTLRIGDFLNSQVLSDSVPGSVFTRAVGRTYSVLPVLVTCALQPVNTAFFTAAWPIEESCGNFKVPVISIPDPSVDGKSGIDMFSIWVFNATTGNVMSPFSWERRLRLHNVPTGCYRFKYVYAPTGVGSLTDRTINDAIGSAQAVSMGASRPFRVLSPVLAIKMGVAPGPATPRNSRLSIQPSVSLKVRPNRVNPTQTLVDTCSNAPDDALVQIQQSASSGKRRCPTTPVDGLEVFASAVHVATGVEYSLYTSGRQDDCARTALSVDDELGEVYTATFSTLGFPEFADAAPGSTAVSGVELPVGAYRLKFTAYGTSALSSYTITVSKLPDSMFVGYIDANEETSFSVSNVLSDGAYTNQTDLSVAQVTVGDPLPGSFALPTMSTGNQLCNATFTANGACMPVPGAVVSVKLVGGPLNSNAGLRGGASVVTSGGYAVFTRTQLTQGASGLYALQYSSEGVSFDPHAHIKYLNVTNPIAAVDVWLGSQLVSGVDGSPLLRYEQGSQLQPPIRVCPRSGVGSYTFFQEPVDIRVAFVTTGSATRKHKQSVANRVSNQVATDFGYDPIYGNVFDSQPEGLIDARTYIDMQPSYTGASTGPDGCVDVPTFAFRRILESVSVAVSFRVRGVDSLPLNIDVLTVKDAHPINLEDLRARIFVPLGMVIAPFGINALFHSVAVRAVLGLIGVGCLVAMWILGGEVFYGEVSTLEQFYPYVNLRYVQTLTVTFAVFNLALLVLCVAATLYLLVLLAWKAGCTSGTSLLRTHSTSKLVGVANGKKKRLTPSPALTSKASAGELFDMAAGGGAFATKLEQAFAYARYHAPRACHVLIYRSGMLHPALIEALGEVFSRYVEAPEAYGRGAAWTNLEARRQKGPLKRLLDQCARRPAPDSVINGDITHQKPRLLDDLLFAASGLHCADVYCTGEGAPCLTLSAWRQVLLMRTHSFGVTVLIEDLRALLPSGQCPQAGDLMWWRNCDASGAPSAPEFTECGSHIAARTYDALIGVMAQACNAPSGGMAPEAVAVYTLLSFLDTELATLWRALVLLPSISLESWIHLYHDRLLRALALATAPEAANRSPRPSRASIATTTGAAATTSTSVHVASEGGDGVAPLNLTRSNTSARIRALANSGGKAAFGVVINDEHVWGELKVWGYTYQLQLQALDTTQSTPDHPILSPLAAAVLSAGMREFSSHPDNHWLLEEEVNTFRCSLGLLPLRSMHFNAFAAPFSSIAPLPTLWQPYSPTTGVASQAGVEYRVDPTLYVLCVNGRHTESRKLEEELQLHLRKLGYSDRCRQVGSGVATDTVQCAHATLASPAVQRYLLHLRQARAKVHAGVTTSPSDSASVTSPLSPAVLYASALASDNIRDSVVPPTAFFYPQRFLIAFATSMVALAFAVMYAMSLTDLLARTVESTWQRAVRARYAAFQHILETSDAFADRNVALVRSALSSSLTSASNTVSGDISQAQTAVRTASDTIALLLRYPGASDGSSGSAGDTIGTSGSPTSPESYLPAVSTAVQTAIRMAQTGALDAIQASEVGPVLTQSLSTAQAQLANLQLGVADAVAVAQTQVSAVSEQVLTGLGDVLDQTLISTNLNSFADIKDEVIRKVTSNSVAAAVVATALILVCWGLLFRAMRMYTLQARQGRHPFIWSNTAIGRASTYIGIQTALSAIAFFLLWLVMAPVFLIISLRAVWEFIVDKVVAILLTLLGTSLIIALTQVVVLTWFTTRGDTIIYRRLYMAADMVYSMLGLFVGAIIAILRLVWAFLFYLAVFMRADMSPLPDYQEHFDPAKSTFNSMLMQHVQFSNPLRIVFQSILIDMMLRRRNGTAPSLRTPAALASARARNRWHLAVMLLFNPSLRKYRVFDSSADGVGGRSALAKLFGGMRKLTPKSSKSSKVRQRGRSGSEASEWGSVGVGALSPLKLIGRGVSVRGSGEAARG